nr:MAG TPA: hypothetical protein [Caudoviricetes sp.]
MFLTSLIFNHSFSFLFFSFSFCYNVSRKEVKL